MEEIKPCPWCGEIPKLYQTEYGNWWLECENYACPVQPMSQVFRRKEKLVRKWNERGSEIPNMSENPTDTEAEEKLAALYTWLNDMRLGIAPDENTPDDERGERQAQVDVIDQIMEWMEENGV